MKRSRMCLAMGLLSLTLGLGGASCSSGSVGGGTGGQLGGGGIGSGGMMAAGGTSATGGNSGGAGRGIGGTGGVSASGGSGTGGGGVTGSGAVGGSGGSAGTGGATPTGGVLGSGGAAAGNGGRGGGSATGGSGGTASPGTCPADATFCSGFEEASSGPPPKATVQADNGTFADLMALDTMVHNSGTKSLKVLPGTSPSAYRMLSVPIPGPTFWVRLYFRSDVIFGGDGHNSIFQAMTNTNHNNSATTVEIAEQFCQVLLNQHDALYPTGLSTCSTTGPSLSAGTWHCMEAFFDGPNGNVQVYADKTKILDAMSWTPAKGIFTTFEFGFAQYHGPARTTWYDDVVVGPTRIGGCP